MIYIANDVESAGGKLGRHSTISIGAAVITREKITFEDYWKKGLVFYAELIPDSYCYDIEAMRVGCSQLMCIEEIKLRDDRFDSKSLKFDPEKVLRFMAKRCEERFSAMQRFSDWIKSMKSGEEKVIGVTDTVFFDGGRIDLCFGLYDDLRSPSPYGWSGLDLDSVYRGYMRKAGASLRELGVKDERTKPHRADQDAVFLAQQGHDLLFEKMGW
ncbi:MAG: hypothetical protein HYT61_02005 [Candidatus Yanofskybacteria bacterium]|nr:hypothetical protein [Candidatus Yanofskybacteria bacterium]